MFRCRYPFESPAARYAADARLNSLAGVLASINSQYSDLGTPGKIFTPLTGRSCYLLE